MKKKWYLMLSVLLMGVCNLFAQGKYTFTFSDYMDNKWSYLDSLKIETRSLGNKFWGGGADFKLLTGDGQIDKLLKKQARFVICNDTLLVNCRPLKYGKYRLGNGYAFGFRLGEEKICFVSLTVGKSEAVQGGLFGLVGGAVVAADMLESQSCYIISSNSNKVERITSEYMEEFLKESPELLEHYRSVDKKRKGAADVVIEYLSKLGLLYKH